MPRPVLRVRSLDDDGVRASFERLIRLAVAVDGQSPFNDQALVDVESGSRTLLLAVEPQESPSSVEHVVGAVVVGQGELEFLVHPEWRSCGYGAAMLDDVLANTAPGVFAWAHGDHPAARALAAKKEFEPVRTLLQLRMPLAASTTEAPRFDAFVPGADEAEWVELNSRVFANHPEQGRMTVSDLLAREAEPWFDAGDFLVARDDAGRMIGYNWLKIENDHGEIYVLGVEQEGRGLGRRLMLAGLERMRERGCAVASLYVEAANPGAVHLYRSLGFADHTRDVQYLHIGGLPLPSTD